MEQRNLIKEVRTESKNVYLYIVRDNKIISVQKEWYDKIPFANREEVILSSLRESGFITEVRDVEFDFSYTTEELWNAIENRVESLTIEITQQCSLRCTYCIYSGNYLEERIHNEKHMSRNMICRCINYYYEHSQLSKEGYISFYGGESLLRFSDIQFAVKYAKQKWGKKKISFQISTNGTTLTKKVLDWLNVEKDVSILMTCNGPMQDHYRLFPDGRGSLAVVMQTIHQIREEYPDVWKRTNFIANVANRREMIDLRLFYMENIGKAPIDITGIKREYGNEVIQDMFIKKDSDIDRELVTKLFCENDPYIRSYANINGICNRIIGEENASEQRKMFCMPLAHSLFISTDGNFLPCEEMCSDMNFGNIFDGYSKERIVEMLQAIQSIFKMRCQECWGRRLCTTCFSNIHIDACGNMFLPESYCEEQKRRIETELLLFCEMRERNPELIQEIIKKYTYIQDTK